MLLSARLGGHVQFFVKIAFLYLNIDSLLHDGDALVNDSVQLQQCSSR